MLRLLLKFIYIITKQIFYLLIFLMQLFIKLINFVIVSVGFIKIKGSNLIAIKIKKIMCYYFIMIINFWLSKIYIVNGGIVTNRNSSKIISRLKKSDGATFETPRTYCYPRYSTRYLSGLFFMLLRDACLCYWHVSKPNNWHNWFFFFFFLSVLFCPDDNCMVDYQNEYSI